MIKLTYGGMRAGQFLPAFERLVVNTKLAPNVAFNLGKVTKLIQKEMEKLQAEYVVLIQAYAECDENGQIKPVEGKGIGSYKVKEETFEEFKTKIKEFDAKPFEVDRRKFTFKELSPANLSALDWTSLEPMINELELVENEAG